VLYYTHNSIGIGHAVRSLAVITGMRRHRPRLDFLVVTGSMVPQLFLNEGVEVLKLPGLRQELGASPPSFQPRLLTSMGSPELANLRRRVIEAAFEEFRPDAVMVEHYPTGLMDEVLPILERKRQPAADGGGFALLHISRGELSRPLGPSPGLHDPDDLARLFDFIYVLDHPSPAGQQTLPPREQGTWAARCCFLGPVTARLREELPSRRTVLARLGWLAQQKLVLICLGRGGPVEELLQYLLAALPEAGFAGGEALVILDPYLDTEQTKRLKIVTVAAGARWQRFLPNLLDVMAVADLVICRAGYNTISELLLTGARALVLPERHPSGEQESRAKALAAEHLVVGTQEEVLAGGAAQLLRAATALRPGPGRRDFDKYAVGQRLVSDLEGWLAKHRPRSGP
jgi:predicted glycosyltransferase